MILLPSDIGTASTLRRATAPYHLRPELPALPLTHMLIASVSLHRRRRSSRLRHDRRTLLLLLLARRDDCAA